MKKADGLNATRAILEQTGARRTRQKTSLSDAGQMSA